jgi:PAS domain S-box-containing protein
MASSLWHPIDLDRAIVPNPLIVTANTLLSDVLAVMSKVRQTCSLKSAHADKDREIKLQNEERSSCVLIVRERKLVGILTERDIVKRVAEEWDIETTTVEAMMTPEPIVLPRSQFCDPFSVLKLFRQYRIRHLPIVDQQGDILGLIVPATLRQILQPADLLRMRSVSEAMTTDVVWVHPDTSTLKIAQLMAKQSLSCVVIAQKSSNSGEAIEPLGIVTEGDLVQFQALGLDFQRIRATEVMSSPVFSLLPDISLWQAHRQMQNYFVQRLIVTGEQGELIGLISQMEILQTIEPWEMYETIDLLRDRVCQLENEKLDILKQQNCQLEQQVHKRTTQLHELNQQLEQRVCDRTAQLHELNQQLQQENQERKLLTRQLQQAEATLRGLFQAMDDVVLIINRDASNLQIIPTQPFFSQSSETDPIDQTIEGFWGDSPIFLEVVQTALDLQKSTNFEYSLCCDRTNRLYWFTAKIVPLSENEALWVARDISDRKQNEVILEQRIQENAIALKALARERTLVTKILNAAGALIVVCARDGRILRFNQTCEQTTGYQFDEVLGCYVWDFFLVPEEIEGVKTIFQTLQKGIIPDRSENYWLTKDGERRLISWSNTVLTDDNGEVEYLIGTGIDITELREIKLALRSSEEKFHYLADNIRNVFFIREAQTDRMLYISPAFEEIWQISCHQVYQNPQLWFAAIHPDDRDRLNISFAGKKQEISYEKEFRIIPSEGKIRWIWERSFPVRNTAGEIETIVGIAEDITNRKNSELISQKAKKALKEMNEELEKRVKERTSELQNINKQLTQEIRQRKTIEEALWESEEELRDLFDNANDLIQSISLEDGSIFYANRAWRETLGYEENELANLSIFDVMTSKCKQNCQNQFQQLKNRQITKLDRIELTFLTKRGRPVILEGNINARCLDSGLPIAARGIFRDITERKQGEITLNRVIQELTYHKLALDRFALVSMANTQGIITYANDKLCEISQYSREELLGKNYRIINSGYHPKSFFQTMWHKIEQGEVWQGEIKNKARNGRFYWTDTTIVPFVNKQKDPFQYLAIHVDITNRKQAEETLQQQLSAIEAAVDGIGILKNNTYTYLNQAHARIFGYDRAEELVGKIWQDLYSSAERERFEKDIFPLLEKQKFWQGEAVAKRKNGKFFPEEISLTLTENGTLICVCRDITERKKNEAEILKALIKEQELSDLKSRFISMTSHEFRTPLAVISSSAGILKSFSHKISESKKQEHLQTIQNYVKHTTQLLDDILTINHAESGNMSFNPEQIALLEFCQSLIQEIQISSDRHKINCTYKIENTFPMQETIAVLDKKLLRQILTNLLSNAIKYSPDGGEVGFSLTVSDRQIEFQVRDSGIGIPESDRESLFVSFNRASNVGTIQGTGLGLSIVKKCVDLHGGQINFNSTLYQGTTFIVNLPYYSPDKLYQSC